MPLQESIRVRMGLHTGEAIKEADDFIGKAVILAARIAEQAHGGQILVASLLKELTESSGEFSFDEGREVELKGLSGQHRVFESRAAPSCRSGVQPRRYNSCDYSLSSRL